MNPATLIHEIKQAGGTLSAENGTLRIEAPKPLPDSLIEAVRESKIAILQQLQGSTKIVQTEIGDLLQIAVDAVSGEGLLMIPDDLLRVLTPEDFEDVQLMTPDGLEALARCVQATMMRQNGQVPPGWTSVTTCRRCGPVWIWPGAAEMVDGCPWCHSPRDRIPRAELLPNVSFDCGAASRQRQDDD